MKKSGILHGELSRAVAEARHKDIILILDAGMAVPQDCANFIDLGLVKGVPSFWQVLNALLGEMIVEGYGVFDLMPQYNPQMYEKIRQLLPAQEEELLSVKQMQQMMRDAKAVVRTGEFGSCCNMVLYSTSGRNSYVEKYNVVPKEGEGDNE